MKAVRKTISGVGNIELADMPVPAPGPKDVLVKVWGAGVCAGDLMIQAGTRTCKPPVTLGHEFSGVVEDTGKEVAAVRAGDRVVADNKVQGGWLGASVDGAFAEYIMVPESAVFKLPDSVSLDAGVLVEPIAGITHCLQERMDLDAGDFVVVVGSGPMGLLASQFAKIRGARAVAVVGLKDDGFRMGIAEKTGANHVLYLEDDALGQIVELSRGGADFVVDCAGSESALQFAVDAARPAKEGRGGRGKIALIANYENPVTISFDKASMGQLDFRGGWGCNGRETWQRAIDLLEAGRFNTSALLTHRYALEDWGRAYADVRANRTVKAILQPNGEQ
ncbi:MAG: alcohol dehydrogenase catalytic domain-containing protein [Clostridiales bacterium]|nr:alcohol dehydrogenase catalytic domain-containing protein [Clostridiales bacterium]